jgi:DNA ligase D-like protein (predicted ligase)
VFERKLDGIRCLAVKDGGRTRLYSRNELSLNDRYAPLAAALDADPADGFVLDGEAVPSSAGRDRFGGGEDGELFYYVFDVLVAGGRDVRGLVLEERRSVLAGVLDWRDPLRMTEQMTGDGAALLARACDDGWEGLIAKRLGTPYVSTRSRDWLKLKCTRAQALVIGGLTAPRGSRTDLGALLVGHFDGGTLRYAGKVGTGFTRATLRELSERLAPLVRDASPFAPEKGVPRAATWVEPELVAQIAFMEWTPTAACATPPSWACASTSPAGRSPARSRSRRGTRRWGVQRCCWHRCRVGGSDAALAVRGARGARPASRVAHGRGGGRAARAGERAALRPDRHPRPGGAPDSAPLRSRVRLRVEDAAAGRALATVLLPVRRRAAELAGEEPEALVEGPRAALSAGRDDRLAPRRARVRDGHRVSLGGSCRLRFQRGSGDRRRIWEVSLEPRSGYVLAGEARRAWQHSIPPIKELRYSITFRTLRRSALPSVA